MGLFSKAPTGIDASVRPARTISGGPMTMPEDFGALPRRARLMAAAVRAVQPHPLAQPSASGRPVGDGLGMEELVDQVKPLFANEKSLIRWVAIRGALLFLDMVTPDDDSWSSLVAAMGIQMARDPFTNEMRSEVIPGGDPLSPAQESAAIGVFASVARHLSDYERISAMSVQEVNADSSLAGINDAVGLDHIAWVATAMCRTGRADAAVEMPEPGMLEQVGWYVDPLFGKAERFWDGSDWTARMRVREGRRYTETSPVPLR